MHSPQLLQGLQRPRSGSHVPDSIGREIDMAECHALGCEVASLLLRKPALESARRRIAGDREICFQELILLYDASPDDLVILIEVERQALAKENLFAHTAFDEATQLRGCGQLPKLLHVA